MKRIILLWVLFPFFTFGQNRYIDNDPYWSLDITKSENFDILDLKKWARIDEYDRMYHGWGISRFTTSHTFIEKGKLKIKTSKQGSIYYTGGVHSAYPIYHYGYYELSAQIAKGRGFWTAFWLYNEGTSFDKKWYNEIDIFEPYGKIHNNADASSFGIVDVLREDNRVYRAEAHYLGDLSVGFHKFAMEWSPDNIFIYVNDNLVGRYTGKDVPSHPMFLYIDQQIGPAEDSDNLPTLETDNSLPQFFTIDYFRYYYLNCDCSQSVVATNYNFKNDYKVKRKYSLSNTKVPNNEKIKLRAETIELGNNFEIPIGTEFSLTTTTCY